MPGVSQRSDQILHSPIRNLIPYARECRAQGVHVHHLNIGQPDILTPKSAFDYWRKQDSTVLRYGASEGKYKLRKTAADYYTAHVGPVTYEDVYVTTGASEAILFTLFACLDAGAEIIIPEPFYANYIGFAQVSGITLVPVTSHLEKGFELPQIDQFRSRITDKTRAIFLCNPGNPTGNLYGKEELKSILDLAIERDLYVIVDEVYREFCYDEPFTSVLSFEEASEHVVVIDSVSKVFSACGARIGFVVSRNKNILRNILKYAELRLCPPMIGQDIAIGCFQDRDTYLAQVKEEYRKRRQLMFERLSSIPGVKSYLPKAAFYIMAELPVDDSHDFCKWLLQSFRDEDETLMMAPGAGFYLTKGLGKNQVRIAFVLDKEPLGRAMDILGKALPEYPGYTMHKQRTKALRWA